jgi:hypothetical protein
MSFFDSLVNTPDYQAKLLSGQQSPSQGLPLQPPSQSPMDPQNMPPQPYAKGGLTGVNQQIKQTQILKVFEHYFQNLGVDVKFGMEGLKKEIAQGLQLIPYESSVLGFKPLQSGVAQIHFFTVGTLKDLTDDMKYFYKYMKDKGIRTVYDTLPAPITTEMLVKLGAKIEKSDNPKYKLKASI